MRSVVALSTQNLGVMHNKYFGVFDFKPKIAYYMDQQFMDDSVDHINNLQQFESPFTILLCSVCLEYLLNIFAICSIS